MKPILFIQKRYQDLKKNRVAMCCPFWINKDRFHAPPVWLIIFREVNRRPGCAHEKAARPANILHKDTAWKELDKAVLVNHPEIRI